MELEKNVKWIPKRGEVEPIEDDTGGNYESPNREEIGFSNNDFNSNDPSGTTNIEVATGYGHDDQED